MDKMRLITLFIVTVSIISCREDEQLPFCELYPDQCVDIREVKEYFCFKEGSF